ncbi:MAG: hypothetical protein E8D41_13460 [Nitrospira sp.]|nr:MAG: hypothetical protein E8D41_13460 [Nitrospira sp.]
MSGLCNAYRRVSSSFRQQALAPRMGACRRDRALRARDLGRGRHAQRTRDDRLIREWPTVVGHVNQAWDKDLVRLAGTAPITKLASLVLARIIHEGSSRNGGVARDKREERDLRDV